MAADVNQITISLVRAIVAIMLVLPFIGWCKLSQYSEPSVAVWLADQTRGSSRLDPFESVDGVTPSFSIVFAATSFVAAYCVLSRRAGFLVPLFAGPVLVLVGDLCTFDFNDPAWFLLIATVTIAMFVGTPVTVVWMFVDR